jgi:hypothetical protein
MLSHTIRDSPFKLLSQKFTFFQDILMPPLPSISTSDTFLGKLLLLVGVLPREVAASITPSSTTRGHEFPLSGYLLI